MQDFMTFDQQTKLLQEFEQFMIDQAVKFDVNADVLERNLFEWLLSKEEERSEEV